MIFARLKCLALYAALFAQLIQVVMGWAFRVPPSIVEGANAQFEVADDGGGFYYPYTMTVLKKVLGQTDQQVGLVYTNVSVFYWDCNQPAGTVLEFRLVSKANVNVASSGNMTVLPGAEAAASSVSTQSVASTASLFSQMAGSSAVTQASQTIITGTNQPSATSEAETGSSKNVPVGVIAGVTVAAVLLLLALLFVGWRVYKSRKGEGKTELEIEPDFRHEETITPFMHARPHQPTPPLGYVDTYTNPYDAPPEYAPPSQTQSAWSPPNSTSYPSTTYASTSAPSEGGRTSDMLESGTNYVSTRYEKRRH